MKMFFAAALSANQKRPPGAGSVQRPEDGLGGDETRDGPKEESVWADVNPLHEGPRAEDTRYDAIVSPRKTLCFLIL